MATSPSHFSTTLQLATKMPTVKILGSTGNVGAAIIKTLATKNPGLNILAGVRNPASIKAGDLKLPNVTLVAADQSKPETLAAAIPQGVDAVFVNTPGAFERTQHAMNGINAAKNANAKHVIIVSVLSVEAPGTIFADQFIPIEAAAKASGIPYTLLRLPLFIDNNFGFQSTIKADGKFYGPAKPDAKFTPIAVSDIAEAAATILANPGPHANKTYRLTSAPHSHADLAKAFTAAVGKPVEYVRVPYDTAKQAFLGFGYPEWQANGILELYHHIDQGNPYYTYTNDFQTITGHFPVSGPQWVQNVGAAFK